MSFGGRLGSAASRLGLGRLGALGGAFPYRFKDAGIRLFLGLKTVHSAVRFALAKTKDQPTRFALKKTADLAARFKLQIKGYKDLPSRVAFILSGNVTSANVLYFRDVAQRSDLVPTAGSHSGTSPSNANSGSPYEDRMLSPQRGPSGGQTSYAIFSTTGTKHFYMARGTSGPLKAQHVNAGNWVTAVGQKVGNTFIEMASCDCLYIWRPSTQTIVVTIRDSEGNANSPPTDNAEDWYVNTYTGLNGGAGPAFDTQDGDVLVWEVKFSGAYAVTSGNTTFYFNGADASKSNRVAVSDAASYIQAPQALQFISKSETKLRFWLVVGPRWKDLPTLVWIRIGNFAFEPIRLHLAHHFWKDVVNRVELHQGDSYADATVRTKFYPLAYRDPVLRLNAPTWTYKDVAARVALQVSTNVKDALTRYATLAPTNSDPALRFSLQQPAVAGLQMLDKNANQVWWQGSFD